MNNNLCVILTLPDCRGAVTLPVREDELTLRLLQNLVGGLIEVVRTIIPGYWVRHSAVDELVLIIDEEGKLKNKHQNFMASIIARIRRNDYIVGTGLILAKRGEELVGIPEEDAKFIIKKWFPSENGAEKRLL